MKQLVLYALLLLAAFALLFEGSIASESEVSLSRASRRAALANLSDSQFNATCGKYIRPNETDEYGNPTNSTGEDEEDGDDEEDDCVREARLRALEEKEARKTPQEQVMEEKKQNLKDPALRQLEKELDARNKSEQIGDDDDCLPVPCAAPPCPPAPCKKKHLSTCHPICSWRCSDPECPLECNPVCDPIQCYTHCKEPECPVCKPHCKKPLCAIRCPSDWCPKEGCPKCDVVCAPYQCHTECEPPPPQCEPLCESTRCFNNCTRPATCKKPKCHLECERPACEEPQCCPCTNFDNLAAAINIAQTGISPFLLPQPSQQFPRFRSQAEQQSSLQTQLQASTALDASVLQPLLTAAGLPPLPPATQLRVFDAAQLPLPPTSFTEQPTLIELMNEMTHREKNGQLHMCCPCAAGR